MPPQIGEDREWERQRGRERERRRRRRHASIRVGPRAVTKNKHATFTKRSAKKTQPPLTTLQVQREDKIWFWVPRHHKWISQVKFYSLYWSLCEPCKNRELHLGGGQVYINTQPTVHNLDAVYMFYDLQDLSWVGTPLFDDFLFSLTQFPGPVVLHTCLWCSE